MFTTVSWSRQTIHARLNPGVVSYILNAFLHHHLKFEKNMHCTLLVNKMTTRMWANAQRDGCPAEHRWRSLFNAAKFG